MLLDEHDVEVWGNLESNNCFIQMVDQHDLDLIPSQMKYAKELSTSDNWCIVTVLVKDWFSDLTPWSSVPIFGKQGYGDQAQETLNFISEHLITWLKKQRSQENINLFLIGYSLAGLFSLWAGTKLDLFKGIAGVSPSVWYPRWDEYRTKNTMKTESVYLSLGSAEEKVKNKILASVGERIKNEYEKLQKEKIKTALEWNEGNHFLDSDLRLAKAMKWLLA